MGGALPLPMFMTKVCGMGGTSIHWPLRFWTWRPRWSEACRSCRAGSVLGRAELHTNEDVTHECEEAGVIMRPDALL